jgi:hypothetical protein
MTMRALSNFLIILWTSAAMSLAAQNTTPFLERRITIVLNQERLDDALRKIGQQGGFSFSYSPAVIDTRRLVSHTFTDKTVREILDQLFNGTVEYKIRNKHVILAKAKPPSKATEEKTLSGYVVDEQTGARLKNVSVYEPLTMSSAVTDSYGYFEIKVNRRVDSNIQLSIQKENYADTTIAVPAGYRRLLNIPVRIDKQKIATVADSVSQRIIRFWKTKILHPPIPNIQNIQDTLHRKFQFSVLPFIGTNHSLSANVVNDYSLNLLGGYARGVRVAEVGGLFNIDRGDTRYGQAAGVFNMVGGDFTGIQAAGVMNANYGKTFGAQFAGVANVNWNSASAFAAAGVLNFTRFTSDGVFVAGVGNFTLGQQKGPHVAGVFNFSTKDSGPLQLSSVMNFNAGNFRGAQLTGVMNFTAGNTKGIQVAGIMNFTASRLSGTQVAGVLNYATKVRGSQIGLVNFCDSISGVPLGIFSFVMKGYHKLEFSADEIFYTNVAFRTGVRRFYNILVAGAKPETFSNDSTFWTFGYGIGSAKTLTRWLSLNIDVTAQQIMDSKKIDQLKLLNKLYLGLDLHLTKHVSLAFGINLNGYLSDAGAGNEQLFTDYLPRVIHRQSLRDDLDLQLWWGGKAGLRFF